MYDECCTLNISELVQDQFDYDEYVAYVSAYGEPEAETEWAAADTDPTDAPF